MNPGEMLRRAVLATTIAELCAGDPREVRSPVCPMCDEGPLSVLPAWQAICGNEDCPVFMWNPRDTPEEFRRKAGRIKITRRNDDGSWTEVEDL